jgi:Protein of unknown function (DUF3237)
LSKTVTAPEKAIIQMSLTTKIKLSEQLPILSIAPRCIWSALVEVGDREVLGLSGHGQRFIIPIIGGQFWGKTGFENFCGKVRSGGADRQLLRADGVKELEALYEMQTDDGSIITIHNRVIIDESKMPDRYVMSTIKVTAPEGPHEWMNRRVFIGTLQPLAPAQHAVLIRGYLVESA